MNKDEEVKSSPFFTVLETILSASDMSFRHGDLPEQPFVFNIMDSYVI